jgi:hypothetical protein
MEPLALDYLKILNFNTNTKMEAPEIKSALER